MPELSQNVYLKWIFVHVPLGLALVTGGALLLLLWLHASYVDRTLAAKEYLLEGKPTLIFAGDSRAAFQLNPAVAAQQLGLQAGDVVNIGGGHGDVVAIANLARRYPAVFRQATLVVSVSSFQVNDGARDPHYYPGPMLAKMPLWRQFELFFPRRIDTLAEHYRTTFDGLIGAGWTLPLFPDSHGYNAATNRIDISKMHLDAQNHPWYKNFEISGEKLRYFEDALIDLNGSVKKMYVYTGGFAPIYLDRIKGNAIAAYEAEFGRVTEAVCRRNKIIYLSFAEDRTIPLDYFADEVHLNTKGADLFTRQVIDRFGISLR